MKQANPASQSRTRQSKRHAGVESNVDDAGEQDEQLRERDLVENYLSDHALEQTLTDLLNSVVADRPADPLLALSSLLLARSTATARGILHVELSPVLAPVAQQSIPAVLVNVHTAKGVFSSKCAAGKVDNVPPREKSEVYTDYLGWIEALNEALVGLDPTEQNTVDEILARLSTPSTPQEQANNVDLPAITLPRHVALACSLAVCQAGAKLGDKPLREHLAALAGVDPAIDMSSLSVPMPTFSVVNGGAIAANKLFAQEILMTPVSAVSFSDALAIGAAFHQALRKQLDTRGSGFSNAGGFGGFAPQLQSLAEVFQLLRAAVEDTRAILASSTTTNEDEYSEGGDDSINDPFRVSQSSISPLEVTFGVDFAASEFVLAAQALPVKSEETSEEAAVSSGSPPAINSYTYDTDKWVIGSSGTLKTSAELLEIVRSAVSELSLASVIDPFAAQDVGSMTALIASVEQDTQEAAVVVAEGETAPQCPQIAVRDALFACDSRVNAGEASKPLSIAARIELLASERACDAVVFELRQFTTISELMDAFSAAQRFGVSVSFGASMGDGVGDAEFLAALSMSGCGIRQVKFGGLLAAECVDRYNRILLGSLETDAPPFIGRGFR